MNIGFYISEPILEAQQNEQPRASLIQTQQGKENKALKLQGKAEL